MDAEDFQTQITLTADQRIDAWNEVFHDGDQFVAAANKWAAQLKLNDAESRELTMAAQAIWLFEYDNNARAVAELKDRIKRFRQEAVIRRYAENLPGDDDLKLGFDLLNWLTGHGMSGPTLVEQLTHWFTGPDGDLPKDFAQKAAGYAAQLMTPRALQAALGVTLLAKKIEGDPYQVYNDIQLRLVAIVLDQLRDKYFADQVEPLPTWIHFFWAVGKMSPDALKNVCAWGERADGTRWKVKLWTERALTPCIKDIEPVLAKSGVTVEDLGILIDKRLKASYLETLKFNLAAAADLARLSVLREFGGIYCDVDIAPGQLDLGKLAPKRSVCAVPLFAPGLRDQNSIRIILNLPKNTPVTAAEVKQAVALQTTLGEFNNNFILIHPNSLFMQPLINDVARRAGNVHGAAWKGDTGSAATGPKAVEPVLRQILAIRDRLTGEAAAEALARQVICNWPLQWLTAESDNLEITPQSAKDT